MLTGEPDRPADDPRIVGIADILERLMIRAKEAGEVGADGFEDTFVALLDSTMLESAPGAELVWAILQERGRRGRPRVERVPAERLHGELPPP
ncbi:hypothetical protein [Streptomyces sp. NPDC053728]|uniref:hypothetical protein n=1 Tax=Streptomyces sp. NPDC053728 TaxID=3155534 RepID=UPI003412DD09